jgi:hypothetical protein
MNAEISFGAHLVTQHKLLNLLIYTHHGVYVGDGQVIHYAGNRNDKRADGEKIQVVSLERFCDGNGFTVRDHPLAQFGAAEIVERAHRRLGEDGYALFNNNCEHFCNWVIEDSHVSRQVDVGVAAAAPIGGCALGVAGGTAIAAIGSAAELAGGAALMKGMATVGVVGGAVGGIALSGLLAGGVAAAVVNNTLLADNNIDENLISPELLEAEREARGIGRAASFIGATGATAATVGAISAAGVSGLSAAGITSGLAAIGGTVGGGMAAGIAMGVAAPAVAAVGVGYGTYKLAQNNSDVREVLTKAGDLAGEVATKGTDAARYAAGVVAPVAQDMAARAMDVARTAAGKIGEQAPALADSATSAADTAKSSLRSMLSAVEGGAAALRKKLEKDPGT